MPIRQRGNRWQADIKVGDERIRKSFTSSKAAEVWLKQMEQGEDPSDQVTLRGFATAKFRDIWGANRAPKFIEGNLSVLYQYLGPDRLLAEIDERVIDDMVSRMYADGKKGGTINHKLAVLSKLMRKARRSAIIDTLPVFERQQRGKARDRELTPADERKMVQFFEQRHMFDANDLSIFLLYAGCRLGDAYKLRTTDVKDGKAAFLFTKNDTQRTIQLPKPALKAWQRVCNRYPNAERPFAEFSKRTYRDHWNDFRSFMLADEDPSFVPHMLRHTCTTRLVRAGVPLATVAKWVGHKSIQTTMRYAHLTSEDTDACAIILEGELA